MSLAKEKPAKPVEDNTATIMQLTLAANRIAGQDQHVNAYEMRNRKLEERRKARVRYKNGLTLPASAEKLAADAARKVRHSRTLDRNIRNATGTTRHTLADAHHIVSSGHPRAEESRRILFDWGIGINDADNGVYLPKKWLPKLQGLEKATAHEMIHSPDYYFEVEARLAVIQFEDTQIGRLTLREIKGEILLDQFVY